MNMNKGMLVKICDGVIISGLFLYAFSAPTTISGQSAGLLLALLGWLSRMIFTCRLEFRNCPLNVPILIFVIALFITSFFSTSSAQSFNKLILILGPICLFYLTVRGVKSKKIFWGLLAVLVAAASLESIYGILQYFTGLNLFDKDEIYVYSRISGSFDNCNSLAAVLAMILPVVISLALICFSQKKKFSFFLLIFSSWLIFLALIFTGSRGAWLGTLSGFVLMGVMRGKRSFLLISAFLFGFLIIALIFPGSIFPRLKILLDLSENANQARIYFWQGCLRMLLAHPLVGVGLDRFGPEYYSHYLPAYVKEFSEHYPLFWGHFHAHNNFLNFAAETGCLGLFSFLFLLFSILKLVYLKWKHLPSLHPGKNLSLGIFISLLTFLIHGLFDFTFKAESLALFWFLTGLVLRIDEEKS